LGLFALGSLNHADIASNRSPKVKERSAECLLSSSAAEIGAGEEWGVHLGEEFVASCRCQYSQVQWLINNSTVGNGFYNVSIRNNPTESVITINNMSKQQEGLLCCKGNVSLACVVVRGFRQPAITINSVNCSDEETGKQVIIVVCRVSSYLEVDIVRGYMQLLLNDSSTLAIDHDPTAIVEIDPLDRRVWTRIYNFRQVLQKNKQSSLTCLWSQEDGNIYDSEHKLSFNLCPMSRQFTTATTANSTDIYNPIKNRTSSNVYATDGLPNATDTVTRNSTSTEISSSEEDSYFVTKEIVVASCFVSIFLLILIIALARRKMPCFHVILCTCIRRIKAFTSGSEATPRKQKDKLETLLTGYKDVIYEDENRELLLTISGSLGKYWSIFGHFLGLDSACLENIEADKHTQHDRGYATLIEWTRRCSPTRVCLCNAIKELPCCDRIVESLRKKELESTV
jgi:hypothetical protein